MRLTRPYNQTVSFGLTASGKILVLGYDKMDVAIKPSQQIITVHLQISNFCFLIE